MRLLPVVVALLLAALLAVAALWLAHREWEGYERSEWEEIALDAHGGREGAGPLPLRRLLERLALPEGTRILEIEREHEEGVPVYELELLGPDGRVYELLVDARTGRVIGEEEEDDASSAGGR